MTDAIILFVTGALMLSAGVVLLVLSWWNNQDTKVLLREIKHYYKEIMDD